MRFDTRLNQMLSQLGMAQMMVEAPAKNFDIRPRGRSWQDGYGAKAMERYRKKRRIRNRIARESRRRNRA